MFFHVVFHVLIYGCILPETTHLSRPGAEWRSLGVIRVDIRPYGLVLSRRLAEGNTGNQVLGPSWDTAAAL